MAARLTRPVLVRRVIFRGPKPMRLLRLRSLYAAKTPIPRIATKPITARVVPSLWDLIRSTRYSALETGRSDAWPELVTVGDTEEGAEDPEAAVLESCGCSFISCRSSCNSIATSLMV